MGQYRENLTRGSFSQHHRSCRRSTIRRFERTVNARLDPKRTVLDALCTAVARKLDRNDLPPEPLGTL